jgi:hypothetical protein
MKSCPLGSFSSARLTARGTFAEHYRAGELSGSCAMLLPDGRAGPIAFDHLGLADVRIAPGRNLIVTKMPGG